MNKNLIEAVIATIDLRVCTVNKETCENYCNLNVIVSSWKRESNRAGQERRFFFVLVNSFAK